MKYIVINQGSYGAEEHYLVSDADANRILDLSSADIDFEVKAWTFGEKNVQGFKRYRAFIFPETINSVKIKDFPA